MNHALIFSVSSLHTFRAHGPHRIASYLREHDWDVEVVDFTAYWTLEELKELTKSRITSKTKFIGFSCFFGYWNDTIDIFSRWIKDQWPDIKTVYGSHSYPSNSISRIDYYVVGYGENAIIELVKSFTDSSTKLSFDPRFFGNKKLISANDSYPSFPMNDLAIFFEDRDYLEPWEWVTAEASRGCKFSCKFCNFPILGVKEDHSASIDKFERQLKDVYDRFGVQNIGFVDETFNQDKVHLKKLAECVDKFTFKIRSHAGIRLDLLISNKDTWDDLYALGSFGHFYGIETLNKKSGSAIGKGMDPEKIKQGLLEVKKTFSQKGCYTGHIGMICGLPYETKDSFQQGVDWLFENWRDEAVVFTPLEIPLDDKLSKLSFMSKNYKNFGYSEINDKISLDRGELNGGNSGTIDAILNWKNSHMDLNWAVDICNKTNTLFRQHNTIGMAQWGEFNITAKNDWHKLKSYRQKDFPMEDIKMFHRRYISKKLSWGTV